MGSQKIHDEARLQNRQPAAGGGVRDAGVNGQGRRVQQLAAPTCTEPNKPTETFEIPDVEKIADVALQVSLIVVRQPALRLEAFVVNTGISTGEERLEEVLGVGRQLRPIRSTSGCEFRDVPYRTVAVP